MSGLLEGVHGQVLTASRGAQRAGVMLAAMGAEMVDDPTGVDFCIVDSSADVEALRAGQPGLVVLVVGEDGGSAAITALEAVSAVVTGLRHAARTLGGQRIDLDAYDAARAAAGESLMIARADGGVAS